MPIDKMIDTKNLLAFFKETRAHTEAICKPLEIEDYVVQPIVDVSPPKWHLGHSSWFFEEFILKPHKPGYKIFHEDFAFVFNSYYETVGKRVMRSDRGNLSRPSVSKVYDYRHYVTSELAEFLESGSISTEIEQLLEIGIHHEKQHQELLLTDIKYILGHNPLLPVYSTEFAENEPLSRDANWISMQAGVYEIGHQGDDFCYDNELDMHRVFLEAYQISDKLFSNGEYL